VKATAEVGEAVNDIVCVLFGRNSLSDHQSESVLDRSTLL